MQTGEIESYDTAFFIVPDQIVGGLVFGNSKPRFFVRFREIQLDLQKNFQYARPGLNLKDRFCIHPAETDESGITLKDILRYNPDHRRSIPDNATGWLSIGLETSYRLAISRIDMGIKGTQALNSFSFLHGRNRHTQDNSTLSLALWCMKLSDMFQNRPYEFF